MIGDRYRVELTMETWEGPQSACSQVRGAIEACGLLVIAAGPVADLMRGEELAFQRGERPVASLVAVECEVLDDQLDSDRIIDVLHGALDRRGSTLSGLSAGRVSIARR